MKNKFFWLALASILVTACGGGSGDSLDTTNTPRPSIVECMTPKVGVSYEWKYGGASQWQTGTGLTTDTYDVIPHSFEGLSTIGEHTANYVGESRVVNGQFQELGHVTYKTGDLHGSLSSKTVNTPPVTIPATWQLGQSLVLDRTTVRTDYDSAGQPLTPTSSTYGSRFEFLAYEDLALGDGTVLKNACKTRETVLAYEDATYVGSYHITWFFPGYGSVRSESYTAAGVKDWQGLISKVIQAP